MVLVALKTMAALESVPVTNAFVPVSSKFVAVATIELKVVTRALGAALLSAIPP